MAVVDVDAIFRKFFLFFLAGIFLFFAVFLLVSQSMFVARKAAPFVIGLPNFGGRVLSAKEIKTGDIFTIERPFEEAVKWGPEAILSFQEEEGKIRIQIWKPDGSGIFLHSSRDFFPGRDTGFSIKNVVYQEKSLRILMRDIRNIFLCLYRSRWCLLSFAFYVKVFKKYLN